MVQDSVTLPQNSLGSSSFCKGPRTDNVWKSKARTFRLYWSKNLCKQYYCQDCFKVVTFLRKKKDSGISGKFYSFHFTKSWEILLLSLFWSKNDDKFYSFHSTNWWEILLSKMMGNSTPSIFWWKSNSKFYSFHFFGKK